jgi:hypothetical protein
MFQRFLSKNLTDRSSFLKILFLKESDPQARENPYIRQTATPAHSFSWILFDLGVVKKSVYLVGAGDRVEIEKSEK